MSYDNRVPREIRVLSKDAIFIENVNPCRYLQKVKTKTGFQMQYLGVVDVNIGDDYFNVDVNMRYSVHDNNPRNVDELISITAVSQPYGRPDSDYITYFFSTSMRTNLAHKILARLDSMGFYSYVGQYVQLDHILPATTNA